MHTACPSKRRRWILWEPDLPALAALAIAPAVSDPNGLPTVKTEVAAQLLSHAALTLRPRSLPTKGRWFTQRLSQSLTGQASARDGVQLYVVERVEQPPNPNALGHAWAMRVEQRE
jgi:hypothetical protein